MTAPDPTRREQLEAYEGFLPPGAVPEPAPRGSKVWTRRGVVTYLGPDDRPDTGGATYWVEFRDGGNGGMLPAGSIQTLNAAGDGPAEDGDAWREGRREIPFPRR